VGLLVLFIVAADTYGLLVAILYCLQGGKITSTSFSSTKLADRIPETPFSLSIIIIAVLA